MKKKIIIIVIIVAIIGIGIWMYLKGKAKTTTTAPLSSTVPASGTAASASASSAPANATTAPGAVVAANNNPGAEAFSYSGVQKDGSQGKAIICYQPLGKPFAVGDSINIPSGPYAGVSKIWYIYSFQSGGFAAGSGQNLYIDKPFTANDKGTFYKV